MLTYLVTEANPKRSGRRFSSSTTSRSALGPLAIQCCAQLSTRDNDLLKCRDSVELKSVVPDHPPAPKEPKRESFLANISSS